jgi:gamma-glutamylcyclotransferase (GGCT)/AIG2-like uncharacterized protein YtfP
MRRIGKGTGGLFDHCDVVDGLKHPHRQFGLISTPLARGQLHIVIGILDRVANAEKMLKNLAFRKAASAHAASSFAIVKAKRRSRRAPDPAIAAIVGSRREVSPSVSIVAAVAVANRKGKCYAPSMSELLFSYGTLRQREVQLATFGRELDGHDDAIVGYDLEYVAITDPHVIATSGSDRHPILRPTDRPDAHVDGTVFTISEAELAAADDYEVDDYRRISVPLRSGPHAWVYVFAG